MPFAFNIYLKTDIDVSATRLYNSGRGIDDSYSSLESAKQSIIERNAREIERYKKLYNIDISDMSNYDLVIDATDLTIDDTVNIVLKEYDKWLKSSD